MAFELPKKLRIATFNVSMEATNYANTKVDNSATATPITSNLLTKALHQDSYQIRNIAEIIQRINPDIILLNEFDRLDNDHKNLNYFITHYLSPGQNSQAGINFPYYYQGSVNTGVKIDSDLNHDNKSNHLPDDAHGFGYFEGHFGMALLSKYPISKEEIRTFQYFKWQDMPNALQPKDHETKKPWYSEKVWQALRLSSKSHWDIPIIVNNSIVHVLASHPTPPVFDGPEKRNSKRNNDEIRFWVDYINDTQGNYIYDDLGRKGGLTENQVFVIVGDLNASITEGDAINELGSQGIKALLTSDKIQDPMPISLGGSSHLPDNNNAAFHTASWGMRVDYVLPSTYGLTVKDSGVFWPDKHQKTYHLIENRQASSDHRLVWVDVELTP